LVGRQNGNWDIFNFLLDASISVPLCYDVLNSVLLVQNLFGFPKFYSVASISFGNKLMKINNSYRICITEFEVAFWRG